jgi:hypothetical protein
MRIKLRTLLQKDFSFQRFSKKHHFLKDKRIESSFNNSLSSVPAKRLGKSGI